MGCSGSRFPAGIQVLTRLSYEHETRSLAVQLFLLEGGGGGVEGGRFGTGLEDVSLLNRLGPRSAAKVDLTGAGKTSPAVVVYVYLLDFRQFVSILLQKHSVGCYSIGTSLSP